MNYTFYIERGGAILWIHKGFFRRNKLEKHKKQINKWVKKGRAKWDLTYNQLNGYDIKVYVDAISKSKTLTELGLYSNEIGDQYKDYFESLHRVKSGK